MLRKDFIVRQFEEFGKVMAVILGFKKRSDWEKFQEEIYNAGLKFTSLDVNEAENLAIGEFENKIILHPTLLPEQKRMLADLLYEKMFFYVDSGDEEKVEDLRIKCLALYKNYSENLTENEFDMGVHYRIGQLAEG
jgi:hypothetical protein